MDTTLPAPRLTDEAAAVSTSFRVGRKYKVEVTIPPPRPGQLRSAVFEWTPDVPRRLTKAELRDYRKGRDAALARLSAEAGLNIMLMEL